MTSLKKKCLACWAEEFAKFHPQVRNKKLAAEELKRHGNPKCKCNELH